MKLSILDVSPIGRGHTPSESFAESVALAQRAEQLGYERVWYAELHNITEIASAATSVVIAHVGAHTSTIRLGAGGIMLPNHSPLVIAEQFGTLQAMYGDRIDLGLGRSAGGDQATMYALRRHPGAAESFPRDVLELQAFLHGESKVPGVDAIPGKGSNVPLYLLGSTLFGARLAARLGLPYAFASHFAPDALEPAIAAYRAEFKPSEQLDEPYVMVGMNVMAADSDEEAAAHLQSLRRLRAISLFGRRLGKQTTDDIDDADADRILLADNFATQVDHMIKHTATGTPDKVEAQLREFTELTDADEVLTAHYAPTLETRLHSIELLAGQTSITS
jgi:luciferase family oxidoreductase group 1